MACTHKVLEHYQVGPPPQASASTTSIPLSFLDIPWLRMLQAVKRLYFYEFPHSTHYFTINVLPTLQNSLSLALKHYFPFGGNLLCPPPPHKPHLLFSAAGDSVSLRIVESARNFNHLAVGAGANRRIRHAREFDHLVPPLPPARFSTETETFIFPLLALQVTVFPNSGICVGISFRHVVDGRTSSSFMKSWASIFRSAGDPSDGGESSPVYDRGWIRAPDGSVEAVLLEQYYGLRSTWNKQVIAKSDATVELDNVRATFVLSRENIERLKKWVSALCKNDGVSTPEHLSKFVVTCALIWVCVINALDQTEHAVSRMDGDDFLHFAFAADLQNRLAFPVPAGYFGNRLTVRYTKAKKKDLVLAEQNAVVSAAKAIDEAMLKLKTEPLEGIERRIPDSTKLFESNRVVAVTGSPKMGVYGTDFGWGRPKKVEVVHFSNSECFSMAESRDEEGGIEVGLALTELAMRIFSSSFDQCLVRV